MVTPDRPQFGIREEYTNPVNASGYVHLVRAVLELYSDGEIVRRRLGRIHRVDAGSRRSDPSFTPSSDPTPEEILAQWDSDGSRKVLREQLDLTEITPERAERFVQFVDDQISSLPFREQHAIRSRYSLSDELVNPSQSILNRAMRMMRHPSKKRPMINHLLDSMQGRLS